MSVMYLGFSDASGITVARGAMPLAGMPDHEADCIHGNSPCAARDRAALDYMRVALNSATSPRADDPAIIGRRSGHASYRSALGTLPSALPIAWEVAV